MINVLIVFFFLLQNYNLAKIQTFSGNFLASTSLSQQASTSKSEAKYFDNAEALLK